eukprot:symbB.v1.2.035077.t1/scaffold4649.1/size63007/6
MQSREISTRAEMDPPRSGSFLAEHSMCVTSSNSRSETEEAEDVDEESRSFYNPPWLQPSLPSCQRRPSFRHHIFP